MKDISIKKFVTEKFEIVITQTPIVELEADPNDLPDLGEKTNPIKEKIKNRNHE